MQKLLEEVFGLVWRKPSVLAPLSYGDAVLEVHRVAGRLAAVLLVLCSPLLLFGMWHCLSCLAEQTLLGYYLSVNLSALVCSSV